MTIMDSIDPQQERWEVGFMPWASLRDPVQIGHIIVWPWTCKHIRGVAVRPKWLRPRLGNVIAAYKLHGRPSAVSAALITRAEGPPELFSNSEKDQVRAAVNIIAYSCFHGTFGPLARTAENFEYSFIQVPKGYMSSGSAYSVGSLHRRHVTVSSGVRERFAAPAYVLDPMNSNPESDTLRILAEAYAKLAANDLGQRTARALDFVRLSYVNYPEFSEANRIVLLCAAFETLLISTKGGPKAKLLANFVDQFQINERPATREGSTEAHTTLGWWIYDFYQLRNRIVHGNALSHDDFSFGTDGSKKSKFLAALAVFDCALRERLFQAGIGPTEESERSFDRSVRLHQYF